MSEEQAPTLQSPEQLEQSRIMNAAKVEWEWWGNPQNRFPAEPDRIRAMSQGALVPVAWPNPYFGLIAPLRENEALRCLRPKASALLTQLCEELDGATGFSKMRNIRLIVTSLYRPDELQDSLTKTAGWYRAAPVGKSAHAAGAAFDIGIDSYYVLDSVTGSLVGTWKKDCPKPYDPGIMEAFRHILRTHMDAADTCNVIEEQRIVERKPVPACFHVCVAP